MENVDMFWLALGPIMAGAAAVAVAKMWGRMQDKIDRLSFELDQLKYKEKNETDAKVG